MKICLLSIGLFFFVHVECTAQLFHFLDSDVNVLRFRQAKELKLSTSLLWRKANIQVGYSPFKYMSIIGAVALRNDVSRKTFGISYQTKGYSYNFGVGFYHHRSFTKKGLLTGLSFDGHLGFGRGYLETRDDIYFAELWYNKYFIRGGIAVELNKIKFVYALSAVSLIYTKGRTLNPTLNRDNLAENMASNVGLNNTPFFVERTWRLHVKIYAHELFGGFTFIKNKEEIEKTLLEKLSFNVGVQIDLQNLRLDKEN